MCRNGGLLPDLQRLSQHLESVLNMSSADNAPLNNGFNDKSRGGAAGPYGPMSPAEGYGPKTDDPVSYQRYFTRIANPGPT